VCLTRWRTVILDFSSSSRAGSNFETALLSERPFSRTETIAREAVATGLVRERCPKGCFRHRFGLGRSVAFP
jgi:hypothetical protein